MTKKRALWISLAVLLVALMAIGSVWDLDIARAVASIKEGEYYTDNAFGMIFEIIGVMPIYVVVIMACVVVFENADGMKASLFWKVFTAVAGIFMGWYMYSTVVGYVGDHIGDSSINEGLVPNLLMGIAGVITAGGLWLLGRKVSDEVKKKLLVWAFIVIIAAILGKLFIEIFKALAGRMRYRAMWLEGDYEGYTAWYQWMGKRKPSAEQAAMGMPSDIYKSFPSGHTQSAMMSILFALIPMTLESKKSTKVWVWIVSIAFPVLVAFSRMVVGAHFLTDVTIGATLTIVGYVVGKLLAPIIVKALDKTPKQVE